MDESAKICICVLLSAQNKKTIGYSSDSQVSVTYGLKTTPIRKYCLLEISDSCIDWKLCVLCQKKTSEDLRCPNHNISDVYSAFDIRKLECLPVKINFGDPSTVQNFVDSNAAWHKQCHQKSNNSKLKCMQLKNASESVDDDYTICYATLAKRSKPSSESQDL